MKTTQSNIRDNLVQLRCPRRRGDCFERVLGTLCSEVWSAYNAMAALPVSRGEPITASAKPRSLYTGNPSYSHVVKIK